MKQISGIFFENNKNSQKIIHSYFNNHMGLDFTFPESLKEATKLLEKYNDIAIIITKDNKQIANEILNYIGDHKLQVQCIVLGEADVAGQECLKLPSKIKHKDLLVEIKKLFEKYDITFETKDGIDYLPLKIDTILLSPIAHCDYYLKMKRDKQDHFVKRLTKGDAVDENIQNYKDKNIDALYILNSDLETFVECSSQEIENSDDTTTAGAIEVTAKSFIISQELMNSMGITDSHVAFIDKSIIKMHKSIASSDELGKLLKETMQLKSSFRFKHAFLISVFARKILPVIPWFSSTLEKSLLEKFVFLSFMHDALLTDDALCQIHSKEQMKAAELTAEQEELVMTHANQIATVVKANSFHAPVGADIIVKQHHGTTNGVGFPTAFNANISPLSRVFIVLEDLTIRILTFKGRNISMQDMLNELKEIYTIPSYRVVVEAFEKKFIK